ncbi:hypothetical protein C8J56DRAFT_138436 [Mycena floridula]|nr:hypothetical protein C8J56DRAFT_138436 [Mycena floridula]
MADSTAIFLRSVDAVCGHLVGARALCNVKLLRDPDMQIKCNVIDLPIIDPPVFDVAQTKVITENLMAEWESTFDSKPIRNAVRAQLLIIVEDIQRNFQYRGGMHCEAGIMAGFLLERLPKEEKKQLREKEAACSMETFRKLFEEVYKSAEPDSLDIGVAKKCCRLCHILATIIKKLYGLNFNLPGFDTRFYAWTPPPWLPPAVLLKLQEKLLEKLEQMVEDQHMSATSSPTSSIGAEDEFEEWPEDFLADIREQ